MPRQKVKLLKPGIKELLQDEGIRGDLRKRGQRVLGAARSAAPVVSGKYKDSLRLEEDTTDRAVVRVITTSPYGALIEAKTGNLSRALDAAKG